MKKKALFLTIMVLLLVSFSTNPSKDKYTDWYTKKVLNSTDDPITYGVMSVLGKNLFSTQTKAKNFYLFSLYETDIASSTVKTIGIFNKFILIGGNKELEKSIQSIVNN